MKDHSGKKCHRPGPQLSQNSICRSVRHNFPRPGAFWNNPKTVQKGGEHTLRLKSQTPTGRLCLAFFAQASVWAHSLPLESGTPLITSPPFSHLSLPGKKGIEEFTGERRGRKGTASRVLGWQESAGDRNNHHRRAETMAAPHSVVCTPGSSCSRTSPPL